MNASPAPGLAVWIAGARPRTLPAAVAPVLAGTGLAQFLGGWRALEAGLALVVALALQVGVNYSNDYSDGIRGTDRQRVGPVRLVGQGLASPGSVKLAAFASFAVAALAGLALVARSGQWALLGVGVAAIVAAWFYTGGPRPYGYVGLGELFVFVFFGLVAVCGTVLTQVGHLPAVAWLCATGVGWLSCAILVVNNLRDIPGDTVAGKRTLAVRLGDARTRVLYQVLIGGGLAVPLLASALSLVSPAWPSWALLGVLAAPAAVPGVRAVQGQASGAGLVPVLGSTGRTLLAYGILLSLGLALS
ncbi:MAG: 1,4-dihydroxy-2-naphthoate polyprenyltransferase [Candidatus Nanopelagicales bacterium]